MHRNRWQSYSCATVAFVPRDILAIALRIVSTNGNRPQTLGQLCSAIGVVYCDVERIANTSTASRFQKSKQPRQLIALATPLQYRDSHRPEPVL